MRRVLLAGMVMAVAGVTAGCGSSGGSSSCLRVTNTGVGLIH
jgi:hypothetical protein